MPGQLLEFYGLREHPFGVSPNPRYLYLTAQHREALATLTSGIENFVGFSALIAEPGVGKTTVLRELLRRFKDRASIAFISNTQCNGAQLVRFIAMELQIPGWESEQDPIRLYHLLTAFASERQHTKPVVIIIDEAQNLENSALETLRLLSNFEAEDRKLLHIILAGQPQFRATLRNHSELFQRIAVIARLGRLSEQETEECIAFRLQTAGYAGPPLFSNEALVKIKQASRGVPREISRICLNALEAAFALRKTRIGIEVIEQVLSDLDLSAHVPSQASSNAEPSEPEPRVPFETELRDNPLERPAFDIPVAPQASGVLKDAWVVDPMVDIGLGDEVIQSVLSGLGPDDDSQSATSKRTPQFGADSQFELLADVSEKPKISYAQADLAPSDEEIRALLSEIDSKVDLPTKSSKRRAPLTDAGISAEPSVPTATPDPRVLKIFAPRQPSETPVKKIDLQHLEMSPEPVAYRIREDPWNTGVPPDPWGRTLFSPQPETHEKEDTAEDEPPKKSRKEAKAILILLCVVALVLILYFGIPYLSK